MEVCERVYPTHDDFRNPFERDRDRIIHSTSFRRLEYKTQVFINSHGDDFRTRLTHSLEASQIGRTIAKNLGLNDSLVEAIALAHDLGHTPFGHIGGDKLDELLKEAGSTHGFEHNFQSYRVVTKLEKRYKEFEGLNLTYATLEGLVKHSFPYKKGYVTPPMEALFCCDYHPSLEAMIVDKADEIAYVSADIDDGLSCGLITLDELVENELIKKALSTLEKEGVVKGDKIFSLRLASHLISLLIEDLLATSSKEIHARHIPVGVVVTKTILSSESTPIDFSHEVATQLKKLKKILFTKLYRHETILKKMAFGETVIKGIFQALVNENGIMTQEYRNRCEKGEKPLRVIADYIAGLTDRSAEKLYRELY